MMKSFYYIILSLAICLCLCACGLAVESVSNTEEVTPPAEEAVEEVQEQAVIIPDVVISEVMVRNHATVCDEQGEYHDWAELHNIGSESADISGFVMSDGSADQSFDEGTFIAPGAYMTVFLQDISVSGGDMLALKASDGTIVDEVLCPDLPADLSYALGGDGNFSVTAWTTPGYENTREGYIAACGEKTISGPVIINEVCAANNTGIKIPNGERTDWIELKNISGEAVNLSQFCISDKLAASYPIPEKMLESGASVVLFCDADIDDSVFHVPFSIDANKDAVYLTDTDGRLVDCIALHDMPLDGSVGRMTGENGVFYFTAATPGEENGFGMRFAAEAPETKTEPGVYNDVTSVTVELCGEGDIYYTLDGSAPTVNSMLYTAPVTLEQTAVIRAMAVTEDAVPSRVSSFSYIINENHTLPVLSLTTDDPAAFNSIYTYCNKLQELPGNLTFFDGDSSFSANCGVKIKGKTSLSLEKKSLGVYFRGRYGDGAVESDIFGNGVTEFTSLSLRAGQDYTFAYIRNELCQDLALENSDTLLAQSSKYCVLYINGEYRGLYCLKENVNEQFYASHAGVSKSSVTVLNAPPERSTDFYEDILIPAMTMDLSDPDIYARIEEKLDIDAFIDWVLFEGWCANSDTQGNVKFVSSTENGGKWVPVFYDLDWSFYYPGCSFNTMAGTAANCGVEVPWLVRSLMQNADFRSKLLTRYAALISGPLSNENVIAKIDEMAALIEPEVARDRDRWWLSTDAWYGQIETLKNLIISNEWDEMTINRLCDAFGVRSAEREIYFN